ncbi:unnamed protein product [Lepeophtheirus salmonis]|uniref:(salmon louse) hypothetical protein n=1 Tax=Lepeophtheirus salmonis TaxID=72036 RepID=A0A7R8CYX0_LEPSM|nr:unnamed protein product [Lepeophtheirus salmonis]CAF2971442.1 unnamed protein product [Lepeophtheirus salmonis]
MEDSNEYSGIVMNKMSIKSTFEYDVGGQLVRGYETLQPSSDEWVTHALVFALVGVKTHWKQVVTYHFTGSSFNQKDIALALKEIAIAAHKSGLIVTHITSDMGPCNQGVRNKIMNKIPNPITSLKDLFIFADVPHLLKKICLFQDLILLQRDRELKLQSRISPNSINLGNFEKMKVSFASNDLLSHATGSAIRFLVDKIDYPESY